MDRDNGKSVAATGMLHPAMEVTQRNQSTLHSTKDAHTIAVGTVDGLVLINKQTGTSTHLFKSTDNKGEDFNAFIQSIVFVDDEQVWLGTDGGGLYLYNLQTAEKRHSLPNSVCRPTV